MLAVSARRACQVVGQPRSTQRYRPAIPEAEAALRAAIVRRATRLGRYGDRRITALLRAEGWRVNPTRVERIWRQEGLEVSRRHVGASDLLAARTHDGRPLRLLTVTDEFTREWLAIEVARHIHAADVLHGRTRRMVAPGVPAHLRADIGPEFTARAVRTGLARVGAQTLVIEPGSPWAIG